MKVLILILSCKSNPYTYIITNGINKTWNSVSVEGVTTLYFYGNSPQAYHDSNSLYCTTKEDYSFIGVRTIEAFQYCLNNFEFDYIFRTNVSSYVHKGNLIAWLKNKPRVGFYSGFVGKAEDNPQNPKSLHHIKFASGSGFSLSRDLVLELCNNKNNLNFNIIDDMMIGEYLTPKYGITPAKRTDIHIPDNSLVFDKETFHFRCKSLGDRKNDSEIMKIIHSKFNYF